MKAKAVITTALTVAIGVFIAGYAMNALRDVPLVDKAINGFDS